MNNPPSGSQGDDQNAIDIASQWQSNFQALFVEMQKMSQSSMAGAREGTSDASLDNAGDASILDPLNMMPAWQEWTQKMMQNPAKVMEVQQKYWENWQNLCHQTSLRAMGMESQAVVSEDKGDRRFRDSQWQENIAYDFIKQSYLLSAQALEDAISNVDDVDDATQRKLSFFARQLSGAMAPTNFAVTNPMILRETIDQRGENLVNGMRNLREDIEKGNGRLKISMCDDESFTLGENIGGTKGHVVFRNDLIELLHYTPTCKEVAATPLLIIPPFINKFYILDLGPQNSFIAWALSQGLQVFVVSWRNPDASMRDIGFEDYMETGALGAIDAVCTHMDVKQINAIGYCIGGTLLAITLAYMKTKKDKRVKSATYFTTMIDFSDPGDLGVFIDDDQITRLEEQMAKTGYLKGSEMAQSFNMLRPSDLIWSFVINNYMRGKSPAEFDLLYWNADSTQIPAKSHGFYLREMYLHNKLVKPGALSMKDVPIDLGTINTPSFILSTKEDHIAPWKSTYLAGGIYKGPITFVLAESGHIAGVINPPVAKKYGYWENDIKSKTADEWLEGASRSDGSWWPCWRKWLQQYDGEMQAPIMPAKGALPILCDAPGEYVFARSED